MQSIKVKLHRSGNSTVCTIPAQILFALGLTGEEYVHVQLTGQKTINLKPIRRRPTTKKR
jgi:antitoxin component of MazEF toxin-antitoxin module